MIAVHQSDCVAWLRAHDGPLFDSCVADPPYELGFMGKSWDKTGVAFNPDTWRAVFDRLKPGAHLIAFSGTRTYHRMACAIEDAGFEIRDCLMWVYGSGFPKSHDVSKGIDRHNGDERPIVGQHSRTFRAEGSGIEEWQRAGHAIKGQITSAASPASAAWQGWGTALKPAVEPICLARKPLSEKSVAANVLKHGTGAINIDACRVGDEVRHAAFTSLAPCHGNNLGGAGTAAARRGTQGEAKEYVGRWPANLVHDGSDQVLAGFPETSSGTMAAGTVRANRSGFTGNMPTLTVADTPGDSGSAARFFYSAKAGPLDRIGTAHATVKPVDLMRWLVRMVTPPGGHVLEPFGGSGTTGIACMAEGFDCTMIELMPDHVADIERKLAFLRGEGALRFAEHDHAARQRRQEPDLGPLFGEVL